VRILIPGCGNAWEGEYLWKAGFKNVYLVDIAPSAVEQVKQRVPDFPADHIILADFFQLEGEYDFIVEQTFFCALDPSKRMEYAVKVHDLLAPGGKLIGLLFDRIFDHEHPPFGGTKEEYRHYFEALFDIQTMEPAFNSIKPRQGSELFIEMLKP
jgi:SAM-dependent methyltransferase